jgi:hypothetical protein
MRRFRQQLPQLVAAGDRQQLWRALASWKAAMSF